MKQALIVIIPVLLIFSCSTRQEKGIRLDSIEEYISEDPQRALDKNYIDVTSDSIISTAVDWYSRHGSPDGKLKAYYYQGRVYENAGVLTMTYCTR